MDNITDIKCSLDVCDLLIDNVQRELFSANGMMGAVNSAYESLTESEKIEYKQKQKNLRDYIQIKEQLLNYGKNVLSNGGGGGSTVPEISNDIDADRTSQDKTASPYAVYNEVHPAVETLIPQNGIVPNVVYNLSVLTGAVTFELAQPVDNTITNHYFWTFDTGATAPTITWPNGITWMNNSSPTINANKHYEISVMNNIGIYLEI